MKSSTRSRRRPVAVFLYVALVLVTSAGAAAAEADRKWSLGLDVVAMSPAGGEAGSEIGGDASAFSVSDGEGLGLRIGMRPTRRWSFSASQRNIELDSQLRLDGPGGSRVERTTLELEMYRLTAEYHVWIRPKWSLYTGALVVMSKGDDQHFTTSEGRTTLTYDDDFGFGAVLGAECDLGSGGRWLLRVEASYLTTILETDSGFADLDLDPASLSVGVAYRF